MITVGPVALTIDLIKASPEGTSCQTCHAGLMELPCSDVKAGVGAVGASTCRVLAATRHSEQLQIPSSSFLSRIFR